MVLYRRMVISQLISLVLVAIAAVAIADQALPPPQALPECLDQCGNLTVPYPFGIGDGCYLTQKFNLTCDESSQPPTLLWADTDIPITNISVAERELQILSYIAYDCYDQQGHQTGYSNLTWLWVTPPFTISGTRNKFIAVGYDTFAIFMGYRPYPNDDIGYVAGCIISDIPDNTTAAADESCTGNGCCQTSMPADGLKNQTVKLSSYSNHTNVRNFNQCSYAFIVEDGNFTFNPTTSFQQLNNTERLPMILNWEIANVSCAEAEKRQDYACKAHSKCVNTIDIKTEPSGYYCECWPGYQGNPYLPDGCQDINECNASTDPCNNGTCKNSDGDYTCTCKKGFRNENPKSCVQNTPISKNKSLKVSLGVSLSFLGVLLVTFWIYCGLKRRKFKILKQKYFKHNGGFLLQQKLENFDGPQAAKIFTREELKKATNNFHDSLKIGEGGYGFVYKGTLSNGNEVAIKVSKSSAPMTQSNQFINEVIVLSQINHRNVVKLLGCCLETQTPLLVYEFVSNGTLYEHIHKKNGKGPLSFGLRMKIATETAGSLAYLHYSTSMQIVHRDVKAANILLDENFTAKVSDFGASKLVPEDQNQLSTLVQGTIGYLDPEYLQSNTLTEKSDVYSFGVVLVELITSQVAISYQKPEAERSLAKFFVTSVEENRLDQILDHEIIKEGSFETAEQVAHLAKSCLSLKGSDRPTMKEVALKLEGVLQVMAKHPWGKADASPKETDYLQLASHSKAYVVDVRGDEGEVITSIDYDQSIQIQPLMMKPYDGGR
ncbi:wall-associated receptor kinase 2-like [Rosa rugosa]|uniref:wall-associated receptor kinase 2-like n=1 Tax=Rosa rugosa TaxID=74645 RepID=UPI002B405773|nr:wall-associated receptor kinase 2-like [Rosa rugosa]